MMRVLKRNSICRFGAYSIIVATLTISAYNNTKGIYKCRLWIKKVQVIITIKNGEQCLCLKVEEGTG